MLMEKLHGFAEGKYDVSIPVAQITDDYENRRTDAWERIENMGVTKRIVSTAKMMQNSRQNSSASYGSGASSLGRSNTALSTATTSSLGVGGRTMPPMARSPSAGSFVKKAPPPPPGSAAHSAGAAPPPPYSAPSSDAASAAAAKRAPPPPPPLKPKPRVEPPKEYVVAMFDFAPQVGCNTRIYFFSPSRDSMHLVCFVFPTGLW